MKYNLEERCAKFGEEMIIFLRIVLAVIITTPLIAQAIRLSTNIGVNYMEANHASSKKNFWDKIKISLKQANETKHWLRMIVKAVPEKNEEYRIFWKASHEITLIFVTISKNLKIKS